MLSYPQLAPDSKGIGVKNVGFDVGELGAETEPAGEKANTAQKTTKNRQAGEEGPSCDFVSFRCTLQAD